MGKRKRIGVRRMRKKSKHSSGSSSGGGIGSGRAAPAAPGAPGLTPTTTPARGVPAGTAGGGGTPTGTVPASPGAPGLTPSTTPARVPAGSTGGGGTGTALLSTSATPPRSASASSSSGGRTQGRVSTGTPSTASSGHAGGTPSTASSGHAGGTGGAPSPAHAGPTSTSTNSSLGSSSSGSGGTPITSNPSVAHTAPPFLTRRVAPPTVQSQYDFRHTEAESFLTHLETHCREEADDLWSTGKWHLKINFEDFRRDNRPLSHAICNNYLSGQELYTSAVRTFLLDHFQTKSLDGRFVSVDALKLHIEEHANLSFSSMPKSITTFAAIIKKSRVVNIFAGERNKRKAIETDPIARVVLWKMMEHLLQNHRNGYCWDGKWSLDDWEIINQSFVSLSAQKMGRVGREHSDSDLVQFAKTVLPSFRLHGLLPSFMQHLQDELNNLPLKPDDPVIKNRMVLVENEFFGWFYTYLKFHPALMSPLARSTLLQGFYFIMDKLDYRKISFYNALFNEALSVDWRLDFYPPLKIDKVTYDIFWHKRTPCCDPKLMPHENTHGGILGFHRHVVQHSPDHGRTKKLNGVIMQSMTNSDEAELMAVLHDDKLFAEFIKKLLKGNNMKPRSEFLKHWKVYTATCSIET